MRRLWAVLAFVVACWISPASATLIFSEDWEGVGTGDIWGGFNSGNPSGNAVYNALMAKGWDAPSSIGTCNGGGTSGAYCSMQIVPAPGGRGGNVLLSRYLETQSDVSPFDDSHNSQLWHYLPNITDMWIRSYFYWASPNLGLPTPLPAIAKWYYTNVFYEGGPQDFVLESGGGDGKQLVIFDQAHSNMICPPGTTPAGQASTTCILNANLASGAVTLNTWHCQEIHLGSNSNPVVEMWLDGVKIMNYSSALLYPDFHNNIMIFRQGANNFLRYEDDMKVATTRADAGGCSASAATPASPTGLHFVSIVVGLLGLAAVIAVRVGVLAGLVGLRN